ncbi:MAG: hypothetical protein H7X97_13640 [Opitutaceae bacterium]|nr:hypothetical protein [Verrucomicrobiales bacterium]
MSDIDTNPYAAPVAQALPPLLPTTATGYFYRDDKYLVVSNHADLPHRCVLTNQPVAPDGWRKPVAIAWTPPWVFVTLLAGALVALILILVLQKKAKITYSLSPEGRGRIQKKKMIGWLLLLVAIGLFVAAFNLDDESMLGISVMAGILTLLASLVLFSVANPVKAVKFRDGWFRLKGCSPEFLDSLPAMPSSPF